MLLRMILSSVSVGGCIFERGVAYAHIMLASRNTCRTNTQLTHIMKSMIQVKTTANINMLSIDSEVLVILCICIE